MRVGGIGVGAGVAGGGAHDARTSNEHTIDRSEDIFKLMTASFLTEW